MMLPRRLMKNGASRLRRPNQILTSEPAAQDVATVLARAVRTRDSDEGRQLFELAVSAEPECAVAWLWLASVTERDATADARIRTALDLDLGPRPWRDACGELLLAIALRRRLRSPEQARAILIDAQYVRPRDARVWVALALTAMMPATKIAYLERALELDGVDLASIRAEILDAAVSDALDLAGAGRMSAASDMLLRASAASPNHMSLRSITDHLGRLGHVRGTTTDPLPAPPRSRPGTWWVRAPLGAEQQSPAGAVVAALADLKASIAHDATLLRDFDSERMQVALRNAAASLTLSITAGTGLPT